MNRVLRGGLALCTGFALTLVAIKVADRGHVSEAASGTKLGALDLDEYCRRAYGKQAVAIPVTGSAYGWRCWVQKNDLMTKQEINFDDACELLYEAPIYSQTFNPALDRSWECYRGPRPEG